MIAADLRKRRPKPHTTWHLDEVYLKIAGRMVYLWRAVDAEVGEVLDVLVQSRRNTTAWHFSRHLRNLRLRGGVDHIIVVGGDFFVQPVG
jgi:transposase-like protein